MQMSNHVQSEGGGTLSSEEMDVLRQQILTYKKVKKGETVLPPDCLERIRPSWLSDVRLAQVTADLFAKHQPGAMPRTISLEGRPLLTLKAPPPVLTSHEAAYNIIAKQRQMPNHNQQIAQLVAQQAANHANAAILKLAQNPPPLTLHHEVNKVRPTCCS